MRAPRLVPLAIVLLLAGSMGVFVLLRVLTRQDNTRNALYVNCTLLANAIVQSGSAGPRASSPQRDLSNFYQLAIHRRLTAAERIEEGRLRAAAVAAGPLLTIPDCDRVVEDPGSVTAIPIGGR